MQVMERALMNDSPYVLDSGVREEVLTAIREVCQFKQWNLLAAHVRTNHIHAVVEADIHPNQIMNAFKAYASRRLNELGLGLPGRKRWARHGSTRWLWKDQDVRDAIRYVVEGQGEPMAVFVGEAL